MYNGIQKHRLGEVFSMRLAGKKVLCLVDEEFEDLELWYPIYRVQEEGAVVHLAGPVSGKSYTGKYGVPAKADFAFADINIDEYDGLLVPGGWAPDKLRRYPEVLAFVRRMNEREKPIGQICHAGWVLISAKILDGRRVTSTPGIRDDMENAGAIWLDEPVVVDGHLVSSRRPPDLPAYAKAFCDRLAGV
jgi:protease I